MFTLTVLEEVPAVDAGSLLSTAVTSAAGQISTAITTVVPVALGLLGLVMAIKIGIRVFHSTANSAAK